MEGEGNAYRRFCSGIAFLWFVAPLHNDCPAVLSTDPKSGNVYSTAGSFSSWAVLDKVVGGCSC